MPGRRSRAATSEPVAAPAPDLPPPDGARPTRGATTVLAGELRLAGRLDRRFFDLLRALQATGSLHRAARTAGYSYKGAWLVLESAGNLASEPLLHTSTGGTGGGGTRLTGAALHLLAAWDDLHDRHARFIADEDARLAARPEIARLLRRFAMKTSARNQFAGVITTIRKDDTSAQVTVGLAGGVEVTATLTAAAAERLKLRKGQEAIALVKASEVVLVTDFAGYALSARNQLAGTVSRVQKGAVSSLVGVTLPGGQTVTASVTHDAVDALGLAVGQAATATFKAYAVMIAVRR